VRERWREWVIVLSIVLIAVTGVWTIWGADIRQLWRVEERPVRAVPPTQPIPPAGNAAGPF
jgi:hypothetical protein